MNDTNTEKQSMKRWLRFICGLLGSTVLLSLIALLFHGYQTGIEHAVWYRLTGSGQAVSGTDKATAVLLMQDLISKNPRMCPDGLQGGDTFIGYGFGAKLMVLQIRDERLVNCDAPFRIVLDK